MKITLVTSDLTYCPENYSDVFESVVQNSKSHIVGVVLVRINKTDILFKLPYLYLVGCKNTANTLMSNLVDAMLNRKRRFLKELGVPFLSVKSISDKTSISWLRAIEPDLVLNMRARCIYEDSVLEIPRLGCVNVHHGILPTQKGLFCDLYAIADGRDTGYTIHKMGRQIDRGEILYQEMIRSNKNYFDYLQEVGLKEKVAIVKFLEAVSRADSLPESLVTKDTNNRVIFTTTPSIKKIQQLQLQGMIL